MHGTISEQHVQGPVIWPTKGLCLKLFGSFWLYRSIQIPIGTSHRLLKVNVTKTGFLLCQSLSPADLIVSTPGPISSLAWTTAILYEVS